MTSRFWGYYIFNIVIFFLEIFVGFSKKFPKLVKHRLASYSDKLLVIYIFHSRYQEIIT